MASPDSTSPISETSRKFQTFRSLGSEDMQAWGCYPLRNLRRREPTANAVNLRRRCGGVIPEICSVAGSAFATDGRLRPGPVRIGVGRVSPEAFERASFRGSEVSTVPGAVQESGGSVQRSGTTLLHQPELRGRMGQRNRELFANLHHTAKSRILDTRETGMFLCHFLEQGVAQSRVKFPLNPNEEISLRQTQP